MVEGEVKLRDERQGGKPSKHAIRVSRAYIDTALEYQVERNNLHFTNIHL